MCIFYCTLSSFLPCTQRQSVDDVPSKSDGRGPSILELRVSGAQAGNTTNPACERILTMQQQKLDLLLGIAPAVLVLRWGLLQGLLLSRF